MKLVEAKRKKLKRAEPVPMAIQSGQHAPFEFSKGSSDTASSENSISAVRPYQGVPKWRDQQYKE